MKKYYGFVPPCGLFCGACPNFVREKNSCLGAEVHCKKRKCKGIYVCCIEKRGHDFCYECEIFPCSRLKRFAKTWEKYGQNVIENQRMIKAIGKQKWMKQWNDE